MPDHDPSTLWEVRQNAEPLRLAMEAGRFGLFLYDVAKGVMECNAQCNANFDLPANSILTYDLLLAMIHAQDRERVRSVVERALRDHVDYEVSYRIITPNSETRWIAGRGRGVYGADGKPVQIIGVTQNVTERENNQERLRNSEQRFRALADNMAQLAWMADASGSIFWYNQRWFDYTGTTLEEMHGWGWQKVHHSQYVRGVTERFREHLLTGQPWEDTFPLQGANGEYRWFLSRAFPVRDESGAIILWSGTNTDVTEQRRAEDALRASEAAVKERELRIKSLYELTSRADMGFVEKVDRLLRACREWLQLDIGMLVRIDLDMQECEVLQIDSVVETLPVGFTCPLEQTFCSETLKFGPDSPLLAIEHTGANAQFREHLAYRTFGFESYLAAIVRVDGRVWGTIAFVSDKPRNEPFTAFDSDMVRLMAQWIGGEVASQEAQMALREIATQQRRFVREMLLSVTEGKLSLCDDASDLPVPLSPISEPIDLPPISLSALRRHIAAVAAAASLSTERTQDLLTAVSEAAMNAVKHGGGGTVRIYADAEKSLIQVWIVDQGTGIREEDLHRATLEKGWSGAGTLGHGFFLILRTVDRTYLLTGPQGTTVVLEQERTASHPEWFQQFGLSAG